METTLKNSGVIPHDGDDWDAWTCHCGNMPHTDGFQPCDKTGKDMEPNIGSTWDGDYVCSCGQIIHTDSKGVGHYVAKVDMKDLADLKEFPLTREDRLENAVRVALTDTMIRAWLNEHDPMLVKQMIESLEETV